MIKIRASSTPLVMKCAASSIAADPVIESAGELAAMGNGTHWAFKGLLEGTEPDLDEMAVDFGVDRDELGWLWFKTKAVWFDVEEYFPNPIAEKSLEFIDRVNGIHLTGTPDVVCWVGRELRIADLKTGFLDGDWSDQVKAYAFLAMVNEPAPTGDEAPGGAYTVVLRARERTTDGEMYTREQLTAWYQSLVEKLKNQHVYNPDPDLCRRCKRGHTCPAKTLILRQTAIAILSDDRLGSRLPSDADKVQAMIEADYPAFARGFPEDLAERGRLLGQMHANAKLLKEMAEKYLALEKADVIAHGGRLPIGNGFDLVINETHPKKILSMGFPLLIKEVGMSAAMECVKIGKTEADKAVRATAGRGQKDAAQAEFMAKLQQAGALAETTVERLEIRKSEVPQIKEVSNVG